MKSLKIFSATLLLFIMGIPAFCDVINPNIKGDLEKKRRQSQIYRQCHVYTDTITDLSAEKCKMILKKEFEATLELLDEMLKESQKYAAKNTENSDK